MTMTHATKMALVPQEMLERFQQYPDPSPATKATLALDTEMKNILDRSDVTEDEKIKLYNHTLSRYLTLDHQRKQPLEMKLTSAEVPISTVTICVLTGKVKCCPLYGLWCFLLWP